MFVLLFNRLLRPARAAERPLNRASTTTVSLFTAIFLATLAPPAAAGTYVLQHSSDAVHWQPWSAESFAKAKEQNKPIFLSIGYSTCHWCHVMQQESWTNPEIAQILNDHFIPILVDREERPDLDQLYLNAAAASGWTTGWPLNVFLTPERKPFFGGSYLSQNEIKELLNHTAALWHPPLTSSATQILSRAPHRIFPPSHHDQRPQP